MRRHVLVAVVVVGLGIRVPQLWAADTWVSVQSHHFLLVGNANESRIKAIARDLEEYRAAFAELIPGINERLTMGTTVVVFKDDATFRPFKPLYQGKPANIAGYFQSGDDVDFIALNGEIDTPSVIYHEYAHRLIRDATSRVPPWANEGLAEFYSTFRVSGNGFDLGRPISHHVLLLREQASLIPLETLLAVERDSPYYNERSKQGIFYAQSWALVHYLMAGNNGIRRPQLATYLQLVAQGTAIDASFRNAFQADYATIEKELREYLRRFTMTYFKTTLATKLEVDKALRIDRISDAQAAAYLGEILLRQGRDDLAEKELQRAIALDSKTANAYKSMGLLRLRRSANKEALEFLTKAVEADSADYLTHFYFAQLLEQLAENESDEQRRGRFEVMRTHVNRAIELAPHFVEAYRLLGYVSLMLRDGLNAAEEGLKRATREAPGREDLQLMLAQVMMANGKELAARAVVSTVRSTTTDADIRRRADDLHEHLQSQIDGAQALREYEARRDSAPTQPSNVNREASAGSVPPTPSTDKPSPSEPPARGSTGVARATPRVAGLRVEGMLVNLECGNGMTLELRTDRGVVRLHSDTPEKIQFVAYVATSTNAISCGPVQPEAYVSVVYQRTDDPTWLGEPTVVELRPKP
jgi:tetratricopeptide (TPR) repeat protein